MQDRGIQPPRNGGPWSRWVRAGFWVFVGLLLSVPLHLGVRTLRSHRSPATASTPQFVGSNRCAACHAPQFAAWRHSHHGLAMQAAADSTVRGDFANAEFSAGGKTTRFSRQGDKFHVRTEGPDGATQDYEVTYTFGVEPLQQYLVPFPGGRLQCLLVAWDTERRRWFALPHQDVATSDWLHWTRPGQSWNTMCVECHSTGVQKRYDPETATFRTTWSEMMVGCEACHGPASLHVAWAEKPPAARPVAADAALVTRTSGLGHRELVNLCAPCHTRRSQWKDMVRPGEDPLDLFYPTLLSPGVFHPDGQILEEDYEVHSFLQSKMYASGVQCTDCHDAHTGKTLAQGNELCARCHRADTYDSPSHHFHPSPRDGATHPGAQCTSCHMPGQTYMGVHFRRDHSMRVPRPDLSASLGTPNACAGCHADKTQSWMLEKYDEWYGKTRKPHYGTILAAGQANPTAAAGALAALARDRLHPAIVRATALDLLASAADTVVSATLTAALRDADALVRRTAANRFAASEPARFARALVPLLRDPVRGVRMEAAARLAELPPGTLVADDLQAQTGALDEYVAAQNYLADMPSGPYNLANLAVAQGKLEEAEKQYRRAFAIDEQFYLAAVNLALLLNRQGRNEEAVLLLESVHRAHPDFAEVAFDLGLLQAERGKPEEAKTALRAALRADSSLAPAAYNLAVLVGEAQPAEAAALCRQAAAQRPAEPRYAYTQGFYAWRAGATQEAVQVLEKLLQRAPLYGDAVLLLREIYTRMGRDAEARALVTRTLQQPGLPAPLRQSLEAEPEAGSRAAPPGAPSSPPRLGAPSP